MANRALYAIQGVVGRSEAITTITATIDPAKWSSRKKNIIIRAIEDGIAACGRQTAQLVQQMVEHHCGEDMPSISNWRQSIQKEHVRSEKLEDLLAYTFAWIRMKKANFKPVQNSRYTHSYHSDGLTWMEKQFLEHTGRYGQDEIPLNGCMTHKERHEFIKDYIIQPDDSQLAIRQALVSKIKNDEPISFTFNNN